MGMERLLQIPQQLPVTLLILKASTTCLFLTKIISSTSLRPTTGLSQPPKAPTTRRFTFSPSNEPRSSVPKLPPESASTSPSVSDLLISLSRLALISAQARSPSAST
ncbi:hypothetical protein E1B28_007044 [Marasmius oreades]|uniref:Uncharacterized protein n=1 Tax=Marasmius oreades TaxID=181124 RepID=A0A9P7UT13_9AGAR|nr:uncharacterized protein E1B28_007044 [Marasmius oreades]KAG7093362.1 hypothetical protein E1B28_007044 [Marasmius oreades]